MKDAVATMGGLLPEDAGGRDAVHVAVFSAASADKVFPGQHVGLAANGSVDVMVSPNAGVKIGIVDPFINLPAVFPGQRFWVYLYPRTITGLSHRWSHPAFEVEETTVATTVYNRPAEKLASEQWLRDFSQTNPGCPRYEYLIARLAEVADGDDPSSFDPEYLHFDGRDASGGIPDEFWKHAEIVLGREIKVKPKYFSCAC